MATTIQERLLYLCKRMELSPEKLSLRAGLSRSYMRRIIDDPKRKSIMGEEAEKLSFTTGVSRSWIVSGVGSPEETDVPKLPPVSFRTYTLESTAEWARVARRAIEIDPKLDWAIMAIGESSQAEGIHCSAYSILSEAELFRQHGVAMNERRRLDKKARQFRKEHMMTPSSRASQTMPAQRRSVPPKG